MGCTLSVIPKSPKKGGRGAWTDEERQPTLVDKWIQFREWVRRNHGKKTKVVPISIKPQKNCCEDNVSNTAVAESEHESVGGISSPARKADNLHNLGRRQDGVSGITVAQWILEHEVTIDTRGCSPVPGIPTKTTRPKAAKGKRTVLPPLEEISHLPESVMTLEEYDDSEATILSQGETNSTLPAKGKCPVVLLLGNETCVPVESGDDNLTESGTESSGKRSRFAGIFRKSRPKAAKGARSVSIQQENTRVHTQGSPQDCLDAWMRRKLMEESV